MRIIAMAENELPGGFAEFAEWMKRSIDCNLIAENRWKLILNGLGITMLIAIAAQFFGTLLGSFICFSLKHGNKFIRLLATLYCGFIHGTPTVVLLMIVYYAILSDANLSGTLAAITSSYLAGEVKAANNANFSGVFVAIATFTMIEAASIAKNLKNSIEAVDSVEIEAARSIGFSAFRAFMAITLPQAINRALPGYTKGFVELIKTTSIVGYIAVQDLTRVAYIIRSSTRDAYFSLLFASLIYLIVTAICIRIFKLIAKKINGVYAK